MTFTMLSAVRLFLKSIILSNPRLKVSSTAQAKAIILPEAEDSVAVHLLVSSIFIVPEIFNVLFYFCEFRFFGFLRTFIKYGSVRIRYRVHTILNQRLLPQIYPETSSRISPEARSLAETFPGND